MRKISLYLLILLIPAIVITSCSGGSNEAKTKTEKAKPELVKIDEFDLLMTQIEKDGDFINKGKSNGGAPALVKATDLKKKIDEKANIHIIDLRKKSDFAKGHINDAVNVPYSKLLNYVKENDLNRYDLVATVCYSGQTASFVSSVLQLMGHSNVKALKWGMASWNKEFAHKWLDKTSSDYMSKLETSDNNKDAPGEYPLFRTGKKIGKDILTERAHKIMSVPFKENLITSEDVFKNPEKYYIINYWPASKYEAGHIPGAKQYTPLKTLSRATKLNTIPTFKPVVVYCYTGQHSAFVAAYLRMLGYDAYSLKYGANSFMYQQLVDELGHAFTMDEVHDYDFVIEKNQPATVSAEEEEGGC